MCQQRRRRQPALVLPLPLEQQVRVDPVALGNLCYKDSRRLAFSDHRQPLLWRIRLRDLLRQFSSATAGVSLALMSGTAIESDVDADWTKPTWDLPLYKSPEFMAGLGMSLEEFRRLPVYRRAVLKGLVRTGIEW